MSPRQSLLSRRSWLQHTAAGAVAASLLASEQYQLSTAAAASDAENWPLFRGDAKAAGVATSKLPEKPEVLWKITVPNGAFESTPVIVGGVVYIGDLDGKLYALDLASGKEKWSVKVDSGFIASPAVRDGRIFLGDIDGVCRCFNAADGKLLWEFAAEAEVDSSANFWKDNVLFGSQDRFLYCLSAADGKLVWKHGIEDQIRCTPTVVEDRAFVAGCDSRLHIIDLAKGAEAAAVEIEAPTGVTPSVLGDRVFFGTEAGVLFAVDWRNAKEAWRFEDKSNSQPYRGSPAVTEGLVVVGSRNRKVHALDPATGRELWTFATKQRLDASPVLVGERLFIGAADGRMYALDRKTGAELWQYQATGGFVGSAAVAAGKMVAATDRGVIYCWGAKG